MLCTLDEPHARYLFPLHAFLNFWFGGSMRVDPHAMGAPMGIDIDAHLRKIERIGLRSYYLNNVVIALITGLDTLCYHSSGNGIHLLRSKNVL